MDKLAASSMSVESRLTASAGSEDLEADEAYSPFYRPSSAVLGMSKAAERPIRSCWVEGCKAIPTSSNSAHEPITAEAHFCVERPLIPWSDLAGVLIGIWSPDEALTSH